MNTSVISEFDYELFVDSGFVNQSILSAIADKIVSGGVLLPKELSVLTDKTSEIEILIKNKIEKW